MPRQVTVPVNPLAQNIKQVFVLSLGLGFRVIDARTILAHLDGSAPTKTPGTSTGLMSLQRLHVSQIYSA